MVEFLIGKNVSKMILLPSLAASSLLLPLLVLIFHIGIALRGVEEEAQQSAWPHALASRVDAAGADADGPTPTPPPLPSPLSPPPLLLPHSATLYGLQWVGSNGVRAVASDSLKVYLNHTGPRGSAARLDNTFCTRFMWLHLYTSDKMFIHLTKMRTRTLHGRWY